MNKEYERVMKQLKIILTDNMQSYEDKVTEILSINGIAILSDDQSLPETDGINNLHRSGMIEAQQDMLKAGFVKVVKGD